MLLDTSHIPTPSASGWFVLAQWYSEVGGIGQRVRSQHAVATVLRLSFVPETPADIPTEISGRQGGSGALFFFSPLEADSCDDSHNHILFH